MEARLDARDGAARAPEEPGQGSNKACAGSGGTTSEKRANSRRRQSESWGKARDDQAARLEGRMYSQICIEWRRSTALHCCMHKAICKAHLADLLSTRAYPSVKRSESCGRPLRLAAGEALP
jgi:hypothetical protein